MQPLADHLSQAGFVTAAPLLSGHCTTIKELGTVRLARWRDDVDRAVDALLAGESGKLFVAGLSFGALLALDLLERRADLIERTALMAPPIRLRRQEIRMRVLARLPEIWLDHCGTKVKERRKARCFAFPREAYAEHSVGAALRMFQLRREVLRRCGGVAGRLLVLQDPNDHLLDPRGVEILRRAMPRAYVEVDWIPKGEHELSIGPKWEQVCADICEFFCRQEL